MSREQASHARSGLPGTGGARGPSHPRSYDGPRGPSLDVTGRARPIADVQLETCATTLPDLGTVGGRPMALVEAACRAENAATTFLQVLTAAVTTGKESSASSWGPSVPRRRPVPVRPAPQQALSPLVAAERGYRIHPHAEPLRNIPAMTPRNSAS